jgi:hypothetical protein
VSIKIDIDDSKAMARLAKQARYLNKMELARGNVAALNRAGKSAMSKWQSKTAGKVTAPRDRIVNGFSKRTAKATEQAYTITVKGNAVLPIKDFAGVEQTKQGVSVKIMRAGKKSIIRGAFIVQRFRGNALTRRGKARGPLKTLYGPSVKQLAKSTSKSVADKFDEQYRKRIAHEINFRIHKANR